MSVSSKPSLSLIILNYSSQFWLKKTLTSLKQFYLDKTSYRVETIVVDNNSQDESVKMIKQDFPWVELVELDQNLGFSRGNNVALDKIETDYVMLMNNDVELDPQSNLDRLVEFMEKHDQAGVITPKLKLADGNLDLACHRGEPTPWASLTYFTGLEKLFPHSQLFGQYHQTYKDLKTIHQIDACSGAAMMARKSAIDKVGLLDKRFFMYAEDLDWCKRFRNASFEVWYYPQVEMTHHKYKSGIKTESDLTSLQTRRYFYNTMLQYYDKHYQQNNPRIVRFLLRTFIFIKKGGM